MWYNPYRYGFGGYPFFYGYNRFYNPYYYRFPFYGYGYGHGYGYPRYW